MATLSFGVKGTTLDLEASLEIRNTDSPRILAWLCSPDSGFGTVTENILRQAPDLAWSPSEGETEDDRPQISWQEWVTRQATPQEAAQNYARAELARMLQATVAWERANAAAAAAASVPDISPI